MDNASLHHAIISSFITRQRPPTVSELAEQFAAGIEETTSALNQLAEYHGVVLRPEAGEIWVSHPFSATPTTCIVRTGEGSWWGNCAWCSLGLAHLVGGSATIESRVGAIGQPMSVSIQNGELLSSNLVVHFPIPMKKAWDNVMYTCSLMLFFEDERQVDAWCEERGIPKGDVRPIQQVWNFAKEWYAKHADSDWRKWSADEAVALFRRHRLEGPIWSLEDQTGRF